VGKLGDATASSDAGCNAVRRLTQRNKSVEAWRLDLQKRCMSMRAKIALRTGNAAEALNYARQALTLSRTERDAANRGIAIASASLLLSDALSASGQRDAAAGALQTAVAAWPKAIEERPGEMASHARLLARAGQSTSALDQRLKSMGYRHPEFTRERS